MTTTRKSMLDRMSGWRRASLVLAGLGLLVPFAAGCSTVSTDSGEVAVHVDDYWMIPTDKTLLGCVPSSKYERHGPGDNYYMYPARDITYKFAHDDGADGGVLTVVKGNVPLTITGIAQFKLNLDCDTLKAFHANIGVKKWGKDQKPAYIEENNYTGWNAMLDTYVEQALQSSATAAAAQVKADYLAIYNGEGRQEFETAMKELVPQYIKALMGGDYFIGFTLLVNKPTIENSEIINAINSKQVAVLQNEAQQQKNAAVTTELESIKQLVAVLGVDGYIAYMNNQLNKQQLELLSKAIAEGKVTILPVPYGSNVNVGAGAAAGTK